MIKPTDIKYANPVHFSPTVCQQLLKEGLRIASNSRVCRNLMFNAPAIVSGSSKMNCVKIDAYSLINSHSTVNVSKIGRYCSIGERVYIGLGYHNINYAITSLALNFTGGFDFYSGKIDNVNNYYINGDGDAEVGEETVSITLGNDVWVGTGAVFPKPVTVGTGAVIGANTVVTKDVPPYAVVVAGSRGSQIIKYRFSDEVISDLLDLKWWRYDLPLYASRTGKAAPIDKIKDFIAFIKNEDLSQYVIPDNWRYIEVISEDEIKLHSVDESFDMRLAAPIVQREQLPKVLYDRLYANTELSRKES